MSRLKYYLIDLHRNKYAWLVLLTLIFAALTLPTEAANDPQPRLHENTVLDQTRGIILNGQFSSVKDQLAYQKTALLGNGQPRFRFTLPIIRDGYYRVYAWWPVLGQHAPQAAFEISNGQKYHTVYADQSILGGQWNELGVFLFTSGLAQLEVAAHDGDAVIVDAIRYEYLGDAPPLMVVQDNTLPIAEENQPYTAVLSVSGGIAPYHWTALDVLPEGLALDSNRGMIDGAPRQTGQFAIKLQVIDSAGAVLQVDTELQVLPASPQEPSTTPSTSVAPSSKKLAQWKSATAQSADLDGLLMILAALPEGEWAKVNLNTFSNVWTPADLRPLYGSGNPPPSKIILAWSSFAWDSHRGDLIIYGGGHANYSGNDVYRWRGTTQLWKRAALPSQVKQDDLGNWIAVDGPLHAPTSAHTYDNNIFLPVINRFLTFGGAAFNNGGAYMLQISPTAARQTGPFLFDPAKADPDKVGGSTGSHVRRVQTPCTDNPTEMCPRIVGGDMWENRDIYGALAGNSYLATRFVNATTAYRLENGKDAIYVSAPRGGGTSAHLHRYVINDLANPALDTWQQVGLYWEAFSGQGAGALDTRLNVFVRTANSTFTYWDLNKASPTNRNVKFTPIDPNGQFVMSSIYGMDYDPSRDQYALWGGGGTVWMMKAPSSISRDGWTILRQPTPILSTPTTDVGTGVLGKWKYITELDAFMALQDANQGNVWLYKPVGWQNPGNINMRPTVAITAPVNSATFNVGDAIAITATANDSDGSISKVEFFQGMAKLSETTVSPYNFTWIGAAAGNYILTVVATDNNGASTTSAPVDIRVNAPNIPPTVSLTAPENGATFNAGSMVAITAIASDNDGSVSKVEFFQGAVKLGEATTSPYSYAWINVPVGSYALTAVATDNLGATVISTMINITVVTAPVNEPPTVSLSDPENGASFDAGATVVITATASDSDGSISKVEFFQGAIKLGEATTSPYSYTWTNVSAGSYVLTAVATDNQNASTTSLPVNITVTSASNGEPTTLVLQDGENGYVGTADLYLSTYHKTTNFGASQILMNRASEYPILIRFTIFTSEGGPAPDGVIIKSARLAMYKSSTYDSVYQMTPLLVNWSEATATWNQRLPNIAWAVSGATGVGTDLAAEYDARASVGWNPGWLEFDVTHAVQKISNGQVNYGWKMVWVGGNSNIKKFASSENATLSLRPKLTVVFQNP